MASFFPLLLISLSALLISPSQAAVCPSAKFKNNKVYANCTVLPSLTSYLHYTYNVSNSSLAVAFIAKPPKSDGWIAWAINPTGTKMSGAQAIIAYVKEDGTPTIKTLNITSYSIFFPGKLAFDFWDTSAELNNGTLTMFATVKVPEKADTLNQVWQVGPGINKTNGHLLTHEFGAANLAAYGPLTLTGSGNTSAGGAPAPAPSGTAAPTSGTAAPTSGTAAPTSGNATSNTTSGNSGAPLRNIGGGGHVGLFSIMLLVLGTLIIF